MSDWKQEIHALIPEISFGISESLILLPENFFCEVPDEETSNFLTVGANFTY